jgi:hypothetical protein
LYPAPAIECHPHPQLLHPLPTHERKNEGHPLPQLLHPYCIPTNERKNECHPLVSLRVAFIPGLDVKDSPINAVILVDVVDTDRNQQKVGDGQEHLDLWGWK